MEKLISSRSKLAIKSLPEEYILPPALRPGKEIAPVCKDIPVIDFAHDRKEVIQQILNACQEFGLFQIINHGVSNKLMEDTMRVSLELFDMPDEDKAELYSEDPTKLCRLYTSCFNHANGKPPLWRDSFMHPCHPLHEYIHSWPQKPPSYRDVVGEYSIEVRKMTLRVLELMCEGLGLEAGYFGEELHKTQALQINHYPPCPDPSLAWGIGGHCDPGLITVLQQGHVYGLQIHKNGQWIGVEPLPHAFVVSISYQLQIISNGKLMAAEHRAVTNSREARTSIVTFFTPCRDLTIQPSEALLNEQNPPLYKAVTYEEFFGNYIAKNSSVALDPYKF